MKTKKIYFFALFAMMFLVASCSSEDLVNDGVLGPDQGEDQTTTGSINTRGVVDGLSYSLENVAVNPNLVVINSENANLESSAGDLSAGIIRLTSVSGTVSPLLVQGNILYIKIGDYTGLRKIENVLSSVQNSYVLETSQAQLGEVFQGGEMDLSLNLYEAALAAEKKKSGLRLAANNTYYYEIADIAGKYNFGGFEYDPATNIKMILDMKMTFAKTQLLPTQFSTIFEIQTNINPALTFAAAINKTYSDDLAKYVPQELIEFIKAQEFEVNIPINTLGIESLPAKISIEDINIPTSITANLSKQSSFSYGVSGSFKAGYVMNIKGLKATTTPVYENTITSTMPSTLGLNGEVLTETEIVITPSVSILDAAYKVSGDIKFGVKTESNGHINLPGKSTVFGTKGLFTGGMNLVVDLILIKVPIQIFNSETELWNEGTIDRTITYSDLKWNVTSSYTTNILTSTRSYDTEFTVNYGYPILGKLISDQLFISYEVYQKDGTTKLTTVKDATLTPSSVTANSFKFKLSIPYKKDGGILSSTYQTVSYLKNIVIKDNNGYTYEGILNTASNVVENSFEIKR